MSAVERLELVGIEARIRCERIVARAWTTCGAAVPDLANAVRLGRERSRHSGLYNAAVLRIALDKAWTEVVAALRDDPTFRTSLADQLRAVPYAAWFWECIRVSDGPFECVVIEAPSLARTADPSAFAEHLTSSINTFENLGGDTILIAPSPTGSYPHFAAFLRTAPAGQADELFRAIGNAVADWEGAGPPWVSTAGMGVPWLHVRLDTRPKYYRHAPYRSVSRGS